MKRIIEFEGHSAILERYGKACLLTLDPGCSLYLMDLADSINIVDFVYVHTVLPGKGKIAFTVDADLHNRDLIDCVCEAIGIVFCTGTTIKYPADEDSI